MFFTHERISKVFRVLLWNESKEHKLSLIKIQLLVSLLLHEESFRMANNLAKEIKMTKATYSDFVSAFQTKKKLNLKY